MGGKTYIRNARIIDEWFENGFDGAAAVLKYCPNIKNYNSASASFSRIQNKEEIQEYIRAKKEEKEIIYETTCEGTLRRLKAYLESDLTESLGMSIEEVKDLPYPIRCMVEGHKRKTRVIYNKDGDVSSRIEEFELKFVSKEKVQDWVNKHIGFYREDNEQQGKTTDLSSFSYEQLRSLIGKNK